MHRNYFVNFSAGINWHSATGGDLEGARKAAVALSRKIKGKDIPMNPYMKSTLMGLQYEDKEFDGLGSVQEIVDLIIRDWDIVSRWTYAFRFLNEVAGYAEEVS